MILRVVEGQHDSINSSDQSLSEARLTLNLQPEASLRRLGVGSCRWRRSAPSPRGDRALQRPRAFGELHGFLRSGPPLALNPVHFFLNPQGLPG
jgi:hypothetical protein